MKLGIAASVDEASKRELKKRDYVGASILGEECMRKIWYIYHMPKPVEDPRVQRIFDMGNLIEDYLVSLLEKTGAKVWTKNPETGEQFGFTEGNVGGHCDGVIQGIPESSKPHLLEFKSANAKGFKEFVDKGCKGKSMTYWVQVQVYMYKLNLNDCLFIVMNKDNQELYFERIKKEKGVGKMYIDRGNMVAEMESEPERKYMNPSFWKCKFCNWRVECWKMD